MTTTDTTRTEPVAAEDAEAESPLLDVRDLHVSYRQGGRSVPAVRGVSFALAPGDTLGIAGESGCGKSTMALGLLRLHGAKARVSGEVLFRGEDLLTTSWGRLRAVRWAGASVVFQGAMSALNPVRTVLEQIVEPIVLHDKVSAKEAERRAAELLDSVGIPSRRMRSYPHEFSGGQRQRVMIAMALACRPDLIIADEPTTALDVMVQAQILELLAQLVRESRIAVIMITHDLSLLAHTCDRLAVMYAGRIVELGPSRQVLEDPRHPYTRALSRAFPTIGDPASRRAPAGLAGDPPRPSEVGEGCAFAPRCAEATESCRSGEMLLWPAGPGRSAACLRVHPDHGGTS
ncbi:ABC transporter ATP-binding protein [Streptomyces sp. NPDC052051]|uniref:ABC transporter ATP-binding protein n=1 Tax=Streptomyces sp. NPDC052051 TaxID=3154649 RepID=UPI00342D6F3E